jgi:hypothetical protein
VSDGELIQLLRPVTATPSVETITTMNVEQVQASLAGNNIMNDSESPEQVHTNLHRYNIMTDKAPPDWDRLFSACQMNDPNLLRQLVVDEGVSPSHSNRVGAIGSSYSSSLGTR